MPLANTPATYGAVARTLHWATALLILTLIPLGIVASRLPYDTGEALTRKALLFQWHKSLGLTLFLLAVIRILWAVTQTRPASLHPDRRAETLLAAVVHWLLYGSLVLVPMTGWIHHAATTGFAPIPWPFGQGLPFVPNDDGVAHTFRALHVIFERVLALSVLLHIAGALKHHLIDRDATLRRMWSGAAATGPARERRSILPPVIAVAVWAAALGIGTGLGLFRPAERAAAAPALAAVASDWTVTGGQVSIAVVQFGRSVTGTFGDWTAVITYDPAVTPATPPAAAGTVTATIAIGSLTLGSVTDQALGPDYLNVADHPVAVYDGTIGLGPEGPVADGTLTLAGASVPLSFPFTLDIAADGTAAMTGTVRLDRRDFALGDIIADAETLGFVVEVILSLTATRGN